MSTNEFPMNQRNLNGSVSVIRSISKWPSGAIETINDNLGETNAKLTDLRLIRRVNLENLQANSQKTLQFLEIQEQKHKKEIKKYVEFIDFCKSHDEYKHILDEFNKYLDLKYGRSNSAPPDYSKTSLMKRYSFKY